MFVAIAILGGLFAVIVYSQIDRVRSDIEPQLNVEAKKHIADNMESVTEMLAIPPGNSVNLRDHHVNFGKNQATVYIEVIGQKKFVTVPFRLQDGEWGIDGPIEVKKRK